MPDVNEEDKREKGSLEIIDVLQSWNMFGKRKDQKDGGQQRAAKDESKRHLVFTKNEVGNSQGVGRETGKFWLQHHIASNEKQFAQNMWGNI